MGWKEGVGISIHFDKPVPRSRRIRVDIMWHRPCEGGGFVFIMENEVLNLGRESLSILLREFWLGVQKQRWGVQNWPFHHYPSAMPPLSHFICAFCRVWSLELSYGGDQGDEYEGGEESNCQEECERYSIKSKVKPYLVGMIDLNAEWRKAQPIRLDFIEIGKDEKDLVYAILVEWQLGIAYRVQRPVEPLNLWGLRQYRDVLVMFG